MFNNLLTIGLLTQESINILQAKRTTSYNKILVRLPTQGLPYNRLSAAEAVIRLFGKRVPKPCGAYMLKQMEDLKTSYSFAHTKLLEHRHATKLLEHSALHQQTFLIQIHKITETHSHSLMLYNQNSAALLYISNMRAQETHCFTTGGWPCQAVLREV